MDFWNLCIIEEFLSWYFQQYFLQSKIIQEKICLIRGLDFFRIFFDCFLAGPAVSRTIFDCTFVISSTNSRNLTTVFRIFFDLKKLQPRKIQKYAQKKFSVSGGVVSYIWLTNKKIYIVLWLKSMKILFFLHIIIILLFTNTINMHVSY